MTFLIIDLSDPSAPALVTADAVLPAVIQAQLSDIQDKLGKIIMTQAQYEADIAAIRSFFDALPGQLDAIKAAMSNAASSGVQDLSALDALATQANAAGAAVGSVVGSPATPDVPPDLSAPIAEVPPPSETPPADTGTADTGGAADGIDTGSAPPDATPTPT